MAEKTRTYADGEKDMERPTPILYETKEDCCGCTACCSICPKGAIVMIEDDEGFEYPMLNEEKCIKCHKCLLVCPMRSA